jgi:gamma-glutamyltranspeptidase/glutathione hydrolase
LRSLALIAVFLLAGCGGSETEGDQINNTANPTGQIARKQPLSALITGGRFAAVAAGESKAAEIGRDVLLGGGNATDAAVAMYFAMAVTLPSAASLGASGACIVHDSKTKAGEVFAFPPIAAPGGINGVPITIPTGVRAVTLMHIRHGQSRWEFDLAGAERLARAGMPVSRALSRDLQAGAALIGSDREARRIFGKGTGTAITEGDSWVQSELGGTLGSIRQKGGVDFFQGSIARLLSEGVAQLGGSLPLESLRSSVPVSGAPAGQSYGGFKVYVAPAPLAGANAIAGWLGQAASATATSADSGGFAGLAAIDEKGGAAACALSMGQLFGARIVVPGTGVLLGVATPDAAAVSPLVIGNPGNGEVRFAGAGGGGPGAAFVTGAIARATVERRIAVQTALDANAGRGGWADAIACPDGIRGGAGSCQSGIDKAGGGLALLATGR